MGNSDDFKYYRTSLLHLLELVEQLPPVPGRVPVADRIRTAMKYWRNDDWERFLRHTAAELLGTQIIGLLGEANRDLSAEHVLELEALIDERLPRSP